MTEFIIQVRLLARTTHRHWAADSGVVTERTLQRIDLATFDTIAEGENELRSIVRFEQALRLETP